MTEKTKTISNGANSPRVLAALNLMLAGKTLMPDAERDRRACAHLASIIRTEQYVPIETIELTPAPNKTIGYRILDADRREYFDNRESQIKRVKGAIERTKNIRAARNVVEFFSAQGKAEDVPEWCSRMAKLKLDHEITDDGE